MELVNVLEMVNGRAKRSEIWDSRVLGAHAPLTLQRSRTFGDHLLHLRFCGITIFKKLFLLH